MSHFIEENKALRAELIKIIEVSFDMCVDVENLHNASKYYETPPEIEAQWTKVLYSHQNLVKILSKLKYITE